MYGFPAGGYTLRLINSRSGRQCWQLCGARRSRSRCREIVLTLFAEGRLVDPMQNAAYQSLRQLGRMAEQKPEAFAELERVWHCSSMDQWL